MLGSALFLHHQPVIAFQASLHLFKLPFSSVVRFCVIVTFWALTNLRSFHSACYMLLLHVCTGCTSVIIKTLHLVSFLPGWDKIHFDAHVNFTSSDEYLLLLILKWKKLEQSLTNITWNVFFNSELTSNFCLFLSILFLKLDNLKFLTLKSHLKKS